MYQIQLDNKMISTFVESVRNASLVVVAWGENGSYKKR